ncbi:MAG: peptidoglycan editing factor PgeF [Oscillospiraceae bacterium]|nr:peptidoglycan editing factor PgeF [Oscillospiraceae bacterium]
MAFIQENENGLIYMRSDHIPARHLFTTRFGGVSEGEFATLNLSVSRGDRPENVRENFRRVAALLDAGENDCCVTRQVHGAEVRVVTEEDKHRCLSPVPFEADGLVTATRGLPIFCFAADCVPVLLCEAEAGVVAAVHCGWRSSTADILGVALGKMCALGAQPERVCAAIGPAIGACCFETDRDVPDAIEAWLGSTERLVTRRPDGKYLVDLRAANARRLQRLGVPEGQIDVSDECTFCQHDKYWSHRYTKGRRGIQAAGIVL